MLFNDIKLIRRGQNISKLIFKYFPCFTNSRLVLFLEQKLRDSGHSKFKIKVWKYLSIEIKKWLPEAKL